MRLLTASEKEAIRNLPCGLCGAKPPFRNGSKCQPHQIKPRWLGGKYTKKNTVPRCPWCHAIEHGSQFPYIGSREGALALWKSLGPKGSRKRKRFEKTRAAKRLLSKGMSAEDAASLGGLARSKSCSKERLQETAQLAVASRSSANRRACMKKTKPWLFRQTVLAKKAAQQK